MFGILSVLLVGLPVGGVRHKGQGGEAKNGGVSPGFYTRITLRGNYVQASTGLRHTTSGSITLSGLPSGSGEYVARAYLIWSVIASSSNPNIQVNGTPVTGNLVASGPTPCWSDPTIYTYIADITDIVRATGDGTYTLSGYYNGTDGGTDGATIVAVYCDPDYTDDYPRDIVIYLGAYTLDDEGSLTWNAGSFAATDPVSAAKLTVLFADGQDYSDGVCGEELVQFNGNTLRSGPYGLPGGDGSYWDAVHVEDATSLIPGGSTSASNYFGVSWDGDGCLDCITAVGEILMVSSTNPETYDCASLTVEEGQVEGPFLWVEGDEVVLGLPFPMWGEVAVYSVDGRLATVLAKRKLHRGRWSLGGLGPGVYHISLRTQAFKVSTKAILR